MNIPNVVICGGGPAGLLTAILLNNIGIKSTVIEEASEPDKWSSKSYAMNINQRGKSALDQGGCLESVMETGIEKAYLYFVDGNTGGMKSMPKPPGALGIGLSRPALVECQERVASDLPHVTIKKGVGVSRVTEDNKEIDDLQVHLEDGTIISATHVIGADGKWSKVRQSFPSLKSQAHIVYVKAFGVLMFSEIVQKGLEKCDGTYIISPPKDSNEKDFYILASPVNGGTSFAMVCSDRISKRYPWLKPEADLKSKDFVKRGWKEELEKSETHHSNTDLSDKLEIFFQEKVPAFHDKIDKGVYKSARINRRASWLQMSAEEGKEVSYSTNNGRVALIGDAAHAMTASIGEGGNCALESAVKLADAVTSAMKEKGETTCTINTLNAAFVKYGISRPKEVQPVQEKSAAMNNK